MMSAAKVPGKATEENVIRGNEEAWLRGINKGLLSRFEADSQIIR